MPNPRRLIESVDALSERAKPTVRHTPPAGSGAGHGGYHRGHHGRHHYYPFYYPFDYFWSGYSPYYRYYPYSFYGYGYYPYGYGYYPYGYGPRQGPYGGGGLGALDLNVRPKKAEVYVDGNPVGQVSRFDGYPGYLWLEPGSYELTFYLEGYQTLTRRYTVRAEVVIAVHELLPPGQATPPPEPVPMPRPAEPYTPLPGDREPPGATAEIGRILLSIRPGDTAVYLDGHFLGTAEELAQLSAGLIVEPGRHTLELVRPGFVTEEVPISVPAGERVEVDLELRRR